VLTLRIGTASAGGCTRLRPLVSQVNVAVRKNRVRTCRAPRSPHPPNPTRLPLHVTPPQAPIYRPTQAGLCVYCGECDQDHTCVMSVLRCSWSAWSRAVWWLRQSYATVVVIVPIPIVSPHGRVLLVRYVGLAEGGDWFTVCACTRLGLASVSLKRTKRNTMVRGGWVGGSLGRCFARRTRTRMYARARVTQTLRVYMHTHVRTSRCLQGVQCWRLCVAMLLAISAEHPSHPDAASPAAPATPVTPVHLDDLGHRIGTCTSSLAPADHRQPYGRHLAQAQNPSAGAQLTPLSVDGVVCKASTRCGLPYVQQHEPNDLAYPFNPPNPAGPHCAAFGRFVAVLGVIVTAVLFRHHLERQSCCRAGLCSRSRRSRPVLGWSDADLLSGRWLRSDPRLHTEKERVCVATRGWWVLLTTTSA
jgi:hypothetical protein